MKIAMTHRETHTHRNTHTQTYTQTHTQTYTHRHTPRDTAVNRPLARLKWPRPGEGETMAGEKER